MLLERGSLASLVLLFSLGSSAASAASAQQPVTARVVVADGGLTEILYALGVEDHIVGVDSTSVWPRAAQDKAQIGYLRSLPAEGILSLRPTLLLTTTDAGPDSTLSLIREAGVPVQQLPAAHSVQDVTARIGRIAELFGVAATGQALIARINRELAEAQQIVAAYPDRPRVLFVLSARDRLMAAGHNTAAAALLALSGADNVAGYEGYKPLTPEAAAALAPQVIVAPDFVVNSAGGEAALLAQSALALTPAGQQRRLVVMPGEQLLSFGPRLGQTVAELARRLRPATAP